ncbi:MAG: lysophospholipid acyltransferase family protein [Ignavibacteria bacterium]|nr:lysophospholipid acyltransferase family protein [Ignavibacteria bacterium]
MFYQVTSFKSGSKTWKNDRTVFFYLLPIRKKVASDNLTLCFPDINSIDKNNILKECYINLGIDLLEFLYIPKFDKQLLNKFVEFENAEVAEDCYKEGRSVFFLSGHISNWELTAFAYSLIYNRSLKIIAKPQASRKLNSKINSYRESGGNEIIQTGFSLRSVYEKIDLKQMICFLIDQSANPDHSVYVKFFNQNTATFSGPAKIALKKRPALVMGSIKRNIDYSYKITFKKIEYDDLSGYSEKNVSELTQRIQKCFEDIIRKNPGQWLWLHKRFKHTRKDES